MNYNKASFYSEHNDSNALIPKTEPIQHISHIKNFNRASFSSEHNDSNLPSIYNNDPFPKTVLIQLVIHQVNNHVYKNVGHTNQTRL